MKKLIKTLKRIMQLLKLPFYIGDEDYAKYQKNYTPKFSNNPDSLEEYFETLERTNTEFKVIGKAFIWKSSPEGYEYWRKVNQRLWRSIQLNNAKERLNEKITDLLQEKAEALERKKEIEKEYREAKKVYDKLDRELLIVKNQVEKVNYTITVLDKNIAKVQKEIEKNIKDFEKLDEDEDDF